MREVLRRIETTARKDMKRSVHAELFQLKGEECATMESSDEQQSVESRHECQSRRHEGGLLQKAFGVGAGETMWDKEKGVKGERVRRVREVLRGFWASERTGESYDDLCSAPRTIPPNLGCRHLDFHVGVVLLF
jgi:hypothetical protein